MLQLKLALKSNLLQSCSYLLLKKT